MSYEEEKKLLADQILAVGKKKGFETMNAITKKAMLEYTMIGRLHKGLGNPTFETFMKIANALDVPVKELFNYDKKPASTAKKRK
jgi:transcriptional regulator with XRE-family HTH domain